MRTYIVVFILIFFQACTERKTDFVSHKDIQFDGIKIDIVLTQADEFSEKGFFVLEGQELLYFDNLYVSVLKFNLEGDFVSRVFQGNEFNGVGSILSYQKKSNNNRVILNSHRLIELDENWEYLHRKNLDWDDGTDYNVRLNNPQAEMKSIYELNVGWPPAQNNSVLLSDEAVLLPIECSHPDFNAYMHEKYYKEAFAFGEFDINDGKIKSMMGKRSPIYLDYKFIPNFDFYSITNYNEDYLVSFAPDSLLWVYDKGFQLKTAFGVGASTMKQDYPLTKGVEALDTFTEDVSNHGYYTYIYFDSKSGLIFRSYFTGEDNQGGLQVYKGNVLIGEFTVPFRFRVFGAAGDYFYADGYVDEENNQLGVYKFQMYE